MEYHRLASEQTRYRVRPNGAVAQLVRAPDCRSGGCGFDSRPPRLLKALVKTRAFFVSVEQDVLVSNCPSTCPNSALYAILRCKMFVQPKAGFKQEMVSFMGSQEALHEASAI